SPSASAEPSPSAAPSVAASPSIEPCTTDGENRSCTTGSCEGNSTCMTTGTFSSWGACIKFDLCCGVSCNDNNACTSDSCSAGGCIYSAIPGCGGGSSGGGGYSSGGGGGAAPLPSSNPSPTPRPSIAIQQEFTKSAIEIEDQLPDIEFDQASQADIQKLLNEAKELQKQGKTEQALVVLKNARAKLNDTIAKSRERKADFTWQIALILLVIVAAVAIYYAKKMRHP
ncbi:MAG: hypothetical protein V1835_07370, partial [Candidatus Micrarchaeota archaeon]